MKRSLAALCATLLLIAQPGYAAGRKTCGGQPATVTGSNPILVGTPRDDVIFAGRGNDSVIAGSGDDLICGARGDDTIHGGDGYDTALGGWGNDDCDTEQHRSC